MQTRLHSSNPRYRAALAAYRARQAEKECTRVRIGREEETRCGLPGHGMRVEVGSACLEGAEASHVTPPPDRGARRAPEPPL